jgi:hypothetical protein
MKIASGGYTIVETLIFLAVSGMLLVSVMGVISGQQSKTEFTTALRDFESRLQDVVNDVSTGYYPTNNNIGCTAGVGGPSLGGPVKQQGTNDQCVFVGKVLHFAPEGQLGTMNSYTLVGARQTGSPGSERDVRNLDEANPIAVIDGSLSESNTLSSGLEFRKVLVGNSGVYGIGLVAPFGQVKPNQGNVVTGSAGTYLVQISSPKGNPPSLFANAVGSSTFPAISEPVVFCIGDPGNRGRLAAVRLDGRGTEILYDSDIPAGCRT